MRKLCLVLSCLLSLSCHAELVIRDAKVRLLPPGLPNTAAYFVVENHSERDHFLVGGKSNIAKTVELHNHIMQGEVMRMEKQEQVKIPAGETVRFQPGGLHLMIFGLKAPLTEGQVVKLTVLDKNGAAIEFDADVVMPGKESSHAHHH